MYYFCYLLGKENVNEYKFKNFEKQIVSSKTDIEKIYNKKENSYYGRNHLTFLGWLPFFLSLFLLKLNESLFAGCSCFLGIL